MTGSRDKVFWADYWDDGRVGTALYYEAHLKAMPERTVAALHAVATAPPGASCSTVLQDETEPV